MRLPNLSSAGDLMRWSADFVRVLEINLRQIQQSALMRGEALALPPPFSLDKLPNPLPPWRVILVSETPDTVIMAVSDGTNWRKIQLGDPV